MQLFKKINELIVSRSLKLTKGAAVTFVDPNGVEAAFNPFAKAITAAYSVPYSENGMTYVLTLAAGFATTLPAPKAGAKYRFVNGLSNTGAHTIVATSTLIVGSIDSCDLNAATDSAFSATGATTITLAANKSVKGDWVEIVSDGTNWYLSGSCSVFDAITLT